MLIPIFQQGKLVYETPSLEEVIHYAEKEIHTLWPEYLRLVNPEEMWVQRSKKLNTIREQLLAEESAKFLNI